MNTKTTSKINEIKEEIITKCHAWSVDYMLIKMDELIKQVVKVEDRRIIKEINDIKCVDIEYRDEFELARSAIIELLTHTDLKGVKNEH